MPFLDVSASGSSLLFISFIYTNMSTQITKTATKTKTSADHESIPPSNSTLQHDSTPPSNYTLPVIDLLQFCTQTEQLQQEKPKEKKPSKMSQSISMFKASSFGIDGSFPPRISSWSRRTLLYRVPRASRTQWSRTKSEMSLTQEETKQFHKSWTGFSSPCFQGASTPIRCRTMSYSPNNVCKETMRALDGESRGVLGGENFVVSKVNLNKRPKTKLMNIQTDDQGNITSISETDPRRPIDLRRSIDLDIASFSKSDQSKSSFFGQSVSFPDTWNNERSYVRDSISSDTDKNNDITVILDNAGFPSVTSIKKIDIKLPC